MRDRIAVPPRDDEPGGGDDGPAPADERCAGFRSCHLSGGILEKKRRMRNRFTAMEDTAPLVLDSRIRLVAEFVVRVAPTQQKNCTGQIMRKRL